MEKQFGELSEFKNRDVELYRSIDQNNVAIYFTKVNDNERKTAKAFFEVLIFGVESGHSSNLVYIRFPNKDYFVQMHGGYSGGRGEMRQCDFKDVLSDSYNKNCEFYRFEQNAMLKMNSFDFHFLTKIGSYDKGNPYNKPYSNETKINYDEIQKALSLKYQKIPDSIRKIAYCFKTKELIPQYILIDYPAYNISYENHRFYIIKNKVARELKIMEFLRQRDGGTTIITVIDEFGELHKFFSPTKFPEKALVEKYDNMELSEVTDDERNSLIELLKLEIAESDKA